MKKLISLVILFSVTLALVSCERTQSAYSMLSEFISLYGAEGIIYSPECPEGSEGYIDSATAQRIFIFHGDMPKSYAVFLNSHVDGGAECGVFVCRDGAELSEVTEMCEERMRLLSSDNPVLIRSGRIIFYSTLRDSDRARSLWTKILKSYT